jgi:hypothetical protein
MQTEGLYRLSGSKAAIDDIKRTFDANGAWQVQRLRRPRGETSA